MGSDLPTVNISAAQGGEEAGEQFHAFLQSLEGDLISAVRAYAGSVRSEPDFATMREEAAIEDEPESSGESAAGSIQSDESGPSTITPRTITPSPTPDPSITDTTPAIPTFHTQLGQNIPSSASTNRYGVTGGQDGEPRLLNFFRAYQFPATAATPSDSGSDSDTPPAQGIVPCIFIGVRSIERDPDSTLDLDLTEGSEDASNPPGSSDRASRSDSHVSASSTLPPSSDSINVPISTNQRPTFRERFLSRISRRSALAPIPPIHTYIVYVIGGNYPANHPVLRIPGLLTGDPLSDEDMALISELMGSVKNTTASKEDIERAGLQLVDGSKMAELGSKGEIMDNSTERCLICLSDYEAGEECRVLACRHGYHRECVDQWLETGSNSCPACRSEGEFLLLRYGRKLIVAGVDITKTAGTGVVRPVSTVDSARSESGQTGSIPWEEVE